MPTKLGTPGFVPVWLPLADEIRNFFRSPPPALLRFCRPIRSNR